MGEPTIIGRITGVLHCCCSSFTRCDTDMRPEGVATAVGVGVEHGPNNIPPPPPPPLVPIAPFSSMVSARGRLRFGDPFLLLDAVPADDPEPATLSSSPKARMIGDGSGTASAPNKHALFPAAPAGEGEPLGVEENGENDGEHEGAAGGDEEGSPLSNG